jgi:hypothetical protein
MSISQGLFRFFLFRRVGNAEEWPGYILKDEGGGWRK